MDIFSHEDYFAKVVFGWTIKEPDLGSDVVSSLLACVVLCQHLKNCTTVSIFPDHAASLGCQMSKRKGTCMEKEEAVSHPGAKTYQRKRFEQYGYQSRWQVLFRPPILALKKDKWFFDLKSSKFVMMKSPPKTPYEPGYVKVRVYHMSNGSFSVVYSTSFYPSLTIMGFFHFLYKRFLIFVSRKTGHIAYRLFNIKQGQFEGAVVTPRRDACNGRRANINYLFNDIFLVTCPTRDKSSMYHVIEFNKTGISNLFLKPLTYLPLKLDPIFGHNGDIFCVNESNGSYIITAYRRQNQYQPVIYIVKLIDVLKNCRHTFHLFSPLRDFLETLCLPGPSQAVTYQQIYQPKNGLRKKGAGKLILKPIILKFSPQRHDDNPHHVFFTPLDGSLLHVVTVKNYIKLVAVYKGIV
ncbi:uncharacterized protein LOC135491150 [Lineus longissimus]|uniref:uncharacterized protein LOC135491150 n=1 Tax=Lineus longissimus TaxID=88925 RepID=UPI00315CF830